MAGAYERTAWAWAEHLRGGGTTPWRAWVASSPQPAGDPPVGWSVPGAAQLEFVRRAGLAVAGDAPSSAGLRVLADLVLSRSGPGRGLGQQPLTWDAGGASRFGTPPADPSQVPDEELVRVGVGALTDQLLRSGEPPAVAAPRRPLAARLRRHRAVEAVGAPLTTSAVRAALVDAGHREGGRAPVVVVLAAPFDEALAQVWSARVQRGAPVRWAGFAERWATRTDLPPSADLPALARRATERHGAAAVHVVVVPGGAGTALAAVAAVLGVPVPAAPAVDRPRWRHLAPAATDLLRRVNGVLTVRAHAERHDVLTRRLAALLASPASSGTALTLPERHQEWARERAAAMAEELSAGGYSVHGDLGGVLPRPAGVPTRPALGEVLDLAVTGCLRMAGDDERMRRAEERDR